MSSKDVKGALTVWGMFALGALGLIALAGLIIVGCTIRAHGQHNHAAGHGDYKDWASQRVGNCCDNRDCGTLKDDEVREGVNGPEVKISDQWCPVLQIHFLIRGKSPDWNVAHACVSRNHTLPSCERLLCFSGKGLF